MISRILKQFMSNVETQFIIELFSKEGIEIRFVGGCIRDALIGFSNYDIDFAINCDPDTTIKILLKNNVKINDYSKKYGVIIAIKNNKKFEITSLREDYNQTGRDTEVKFTDDWNKDALRRDFTFNAMYLSLSGKLYDYFDGEEDLNNGIVRFIGNPNTSIKEDFIRILRFHRFLGCFKNINIFTGYEEIINKNISFIKNNINNDVIKNELIKMFNNPYPINSFCNYKDPKQKNNLIKKIKQWWLEEKYEIGIKKCFIEIDKLF
mgnify:CR=1 FL=1